MRGEAFVLAGAMLAMAALAPAGGSTGPAAGDPLVVVAHIDVGINPYHDDFAWGDPRAQQHPCTYLPNFPCAAPALQLHLDEPDWSTAFNSDASVWASVMPGTLYWVPGTKIVGAISLDQDGATPILDDHGHGTMTASRSAGNSHSLCPECLFVSIEGIGTDGVAWAAASGFVDVQTNSWGFIAPVVPGFMDPIAQAAATHPTFFASGNGLFFQGFVSAPSYETTGAPGTVQVGAHDNGHLLTWPGSPPHVIADGYGPWTAVRDSVSVVRPDPVACCTSTAAPYAAGGGAALVVEAKRILGDLGAGPDGAGVLASGPAGLVPQGPLVDGDLTLDELLRVLYHTATLRPAEGPDDGLLNWLGGSDPLGALASNPGGHLSNPGQNPYCRGCFSTPVRWQDVPGDASLWDREGYGAIDPVSVSLGRAVLRGEVAEPERPVEDALLVADQAVREAWLALLG